MASSLQSDPSFDYKYQEMTQVTDHNMAHLGVTMWLGQEDYFCPLASDFGEMINDSSLLMPETNSIDSSSTTSMVGASIGAPPEADNHDELLPSEYCKLGYDSLLGGYYEESGESGYGVGYYNNNQLSDNGEEAGNNISGGTYGSYVPANNYTVATSESSGVKGHITSGCGENNAKVGRYSVEERRDRILRYLKKRNQRNFNKTIKYACRKTLADRRVRIRGRFARNDEGETRTNSEGEIPHEERSISPYVKADKEEQLCDDEWLQEAIESLMYMPYIPGWHGEVILN